MERGKNSRNKEEIKKTDMLWTYIRSFLAIVYRYEEFFNISDEFFFLLFFLVEKKEVLNQGGGIDRKGEREKRESLK